MLKGVILNIENFKQTSDVHLSGFDMLITTYTAGAVRFVRRVKDSICLCRAVVVGKTKNETNKKKTTKNYEKLKKLDTSTETQLQNGKWRTFGGAGNWWFYFNSNQILMDYTMLRLNSTGLLWNLVINLFVCFKSKIVRSVPVKCKGLITLIGIIFYDFVKMSKWFNI